MHEQAAALAAQQPSPDEQTAANLQLQLGFQQQQALLQQQPQPPTAESPQQLMANDASAFAVINPLKAQSPYAAEPDRPAAKATADGSIEERLFDDEADEERVSEGSADKAGGGVSSSSAAAAPTISQLMAMAPIIPTIPVGPTIGTMQSLG